MAESKVTTVWLEQAAMRYALCKLHGVVVEEGDAAKRVMVSPSDLQLHLDHLQGKLLTEAETYFRECAMAGAGYPIQQGMEARKEE